MAYTFKKFSDVEALTEVPDGANALVEVNGAIKRVPGSGLGGGGVKTAIIKSSDYDNAIAGVSTLADATPTVTYSCTNMTFEEAHQTMLDGDPLGVVFMDVIKGPTNLSGVSALADALSGVPCIMLLATAINGELILYWTADGISTAKPSSGK